MNVKENVFSSEREFKKALRDTFKFKFSLFASSARGMNSYQQAAGMSADNVLG